MFDDIEPDQSSLTPLDRSPYPYPIIHFSKFENLFTFLNKRYLFKQSILLSSINEVDNAGPEEISLSSTCEYYF